ncbi:MAG: 3-isopropylmalate dehydratase small subunit [Coriobacteriales bacterium]
MQFTGSVIKYGRDVDTDAIIAARYLNSSDMDELAKHCMEDIDPTFAQRAKPGDIIVADENFGCGSSREHAPSCIKAAGISCVIAKSFARIFYRNAINVGLPIIECPEAVDAISEGDTVFFDTEAGIITDLTTGATFNARPFPPFIQEIIEAGGLVARTRKRGGVA